MSRSPNRRSQSLIGELSAGTLASWQSHWKLNPESAVGRRDRKLYDYAQTAAQASLRPGHDPVGPPRHGSWREMNLTADEVAWDSWTAMWDYQAGSLVWLQDRNLFTYAWDAAAVQNDSVP